MACPSRRMVVYWRATLPCATRDRSSAGTSDSGCDTARSASEPIRLGTMTGSNTPAVEFWAPEDPSTRPISASARRSWSRSEFGSESAPDRLFCTVCRALPISTVAASIFDCSSPAVICCCRIRPRVIIAIADRVSVSPTMRSSSDRLQKASRDLAVARERPARSRRRASRPPAGWPWPAAGDAADVAAVEAGGSAAGSGSVVTAQ